MVPYHYNAVRKTAGNQKHGMPAQLPLNKKKRKHLYIKFYQDYWFYFRDIGLVPCSVMELEHFVYLISIQSIWTNHRLLLYRHTMLKGLSIFHTYMHARALKINYHTCTCLKNQSFFLAV